MRIALLCPTRERPKDVKRLIDSILNTVSNRDNVTLYLGVDEDDPTKSEILKFEQEYNFVKWIPIHNEGKFLGLGKIWNLMAAEAKEEIFGLLGDDMVFETRDWDLEILKEFADTKIKLVFFNDCLRGPGNHYSNVSVLAVNSFISRIYYDVFGYYTTEHFKHGFHDNFLHDTYNIIQRVVYRHDIRLNHLHVCNPASGAVVDRVTQNLNQAYASIANPQALYDSLLPERKKQAEKLKELLILETRGN